MRVLAIETSCDDTSVAVVDSQGLVFSLVSRNQDLQHAPFGGIVPEIACRNHSQALLPLIDEALKKSHFSWKDVDGIAVTNRPGLIGSLIVGVITAKTLSQSLGKELIGVNHLEGHLLAPFLRDEEFAPPDDFKPPYLALAVSGGHSTIYRVHGFGDYEVLGATLDDAAGEAFDKFAKMVGLGFPGGAKVDKLSQGGNPKAYDLPRGLLHEDSLSMSFSGVKASGQRLVDSLGPKAVETHLADLCASFQEAVVDALLAKLKLAQEKTGLRRIVLTGGVSANSRLRSRAAEWAQKKNLQLVVPPLRYCTDNAAMIGFAGAIRLQRGEKSDLSLGPSPRSIPGDFR